jgi:hypothetical protein
MNEDLVHPLVVQGLIAGFNGRDDVHQARGVPALIQHVRKDLLLPDVGLAMCSIVTRASAAGDAARSRKRSRSVSANSG